MNPILWVFANPGLVFVLGAITIAVFAAVDGPAYGMSWPSWSKSSRDEFLDEEPDPDYIADIHSDVEADRREDRESRSLRGWEGMEP